MTTASHSSYGVAERSRRWRGRQASSCKAKGIPYVEKVGACHVGFDPLPPNYGVEEKVDSRKIP